MRKAFTFVELLIVMAIVAILAWILLPIFAESRESQRNAGGLAQMRQIFEASSLYNEDSDGRFVPIGAPFMDSSWSPARDRKVDAAGRPWNGWGLKLAHYATSKEIFRSQMAPRQGNFTGACGHAKGMALTNSYAMNWFLGSDRSYSPSDDPSYTRTPSGKPLSRPMFVTEVVEPRKTIALMLSTATPPYGQEWGCLFSTLEASDFTNKIRFRGVHRGGANMSFVDGHARWYEAREADPTSNGETIYSWVSRGIWMQPTMPNDTMGYRNSDHVR